MLKSFTVILLSCLLTLSIFSPSVMSLMSVDCAVVMNDFEDEEKEESQEKEIEDTDIEEENEERFFQSLTSINDSLPFNNRMVSVFVIEDISVYSLDIHLLPPEYTI